MIELETEKVDIPKRGGGRAGKYPWDKMTPGGVPFFAPGVSSKGMQSSVSYRKKGHPGEKYMIRSFVKDGVAGAMVWRIA